MNKKEQKAFDDAIAKIRLLSALRWTQVVETDVAIPGSYSTLAKGWLFNTHYLIAERSCSSSVYHAYGRDDKTTSQNPRRLYSTQLLALKACRNAVELESAKRLATLDAAIAALETP